MIGKDFVSAVHLRTGVSHNNGSTIRPQELKGASGIIPQVKVNYVEVGLFCGQNKEVCRQQCELIFRNLSDKVRRGDNISHELPLIGRLVIKNGLAAIAFNPDLIEQSRGNTAKQFAVGNLFSNSNTVLNMNIHNKNSAALNAQFGLGGAMKVTGEATGWLRDNLDIDIDGMPERQEDSQAASTYSLTQARVQSAHPAGSARKLPTRVGSMYSLTAGRNQALSEAQLDAFDRQSRTSGTKRASSY